MRSNIIISLALAISFASAQECEKLASLALPGSAAGTLPDVTALVTVTSMPQVVLPAFVSIGEPGGLVKVLLTAPDGAALGSETTKGAYPPTVTGTELSSPMVPMT